MKKLSLTAILLLASFSAFAQTARSILANFGKAQYQAKSLKATYMGQEIGGVPTTFNVQLSKPNLARIDTSTDVIVANGTTITTYNKADNVYFKRPQTEPALLGYFENIGLSMLKGFFTPGELSAVPLARHIGKKTLRGSEVTLIEAAIDKLGHRMQTYAFSPNNELKQIVVKYSDHPESEVFNFDSITLGTEPLKDEVFQFTPPSGARELNLNDVAQGKWFDDKKDAFRLANITGRGVMVAYVTSWSEQCKNLQRQVFNSPEFKSVAEHFVFYRIDVEKHPDQAAEAGVKNVPEVRFLTADGRVLLKVQGAVGLHDFMASAMTAASYLPKKR